MSLNSDGLSQRCFHNVCKTEDGVQQTLLPCPPQNQSSTPMPTPAPVGRSLLGIPPLHRSLLQRRQHLTNHQCYAIARAILPSIHVFVVLCVLHYRNLHVCMTAVLISRHTEGSFSFLKRDKFVQPTR